MIRLQINTYRDGTAEPCDMNNGVLNHGTSTRTHNGQSKVYSLQSNPT